jgi:hypothetical protein
VQRSVSDGLRLPGMLSILRRWRLRLHR